MKPKTMPKFSRLANADATISLHVARVKIGRDDVYTYKGTETDVQTGRDGVQGA